MNTLGISVAPFGYNPHYDLLERYHADRTEHSGRTFLDHLKGVERILREWGMLEHVCIAGLFHSIYGTNIFTVQSAPFEDRSVIELMIGKPAERLAYLFCVADRPQSFFDEARVGTITNRLTGANEHVTGVERQELIVIEAANHIEQDMGPKLIEYIWDSSQHNILFTAKAMNDMRRFMYKHGITR